MDYKVSILAMAIAAGFSSGALAACPNGQQEFFSASGAGTAADPYVAVPHCEQTSGNWWSGHLSGIPVIDPATGKQLMVDGHPIVSGFNNSFNTPVVYGQSGLAAGDGAKVGDWIPQVGTPAGCTNGGTLGANNSCTPAPTSPTFTQGSNVPAGCTNGGVLANGACTPAPTAFVPASADYVPAHAFNVNNGTAIGAGASVQHDHSTAIGAGATTTAPNQIMLGTSADTVVMPGNVTMKGSITSTSSTGASTKVDGDGFTYTDGKGGKVTIGGDPTITVTNGTSTTTITNGDITNTGNVTTGGTTTTGSLHVTGSSVFDGAITVNTTGGQTKVTGGGAVFTDPSGGTTTVAGGDVTSTGTISGAKVFAGGRDVGQSLTDHDTRITKVQTQADSTDHRLNVFNGTGGTIENWASGVDSWRGDVNAELAHQDGRLSSLESWRGVASAQIASLQGDVKKLQGGVSLAMASKVPSLDRGEKFGLSVNVADFDGTGAVAGGIAFRIDQNWQINASGGAGFSGGASGGTIGLVGKW